MKKPKKVSRYLGIPYIDIPRYPETIDDYDRNSFTQFLTRLFPFDPDTVQAAIFDYKIGTYRGWTSFPVIDRQGRFCKAKLMRFDPETGKRLKDIHGRGLISSLQQELKKAGPLKQDFESDKDIFFGDHLTAKYPARPIAIVELEKTAIIASLCKGVFPDLVWLATGSKQSLTADHIRRLGRDRKVFLYPDADGFAQWQMIASDASRLGCQVQVSRLIETLATNAEKDDQVDLADYLIAEQRRRNDPANREAFLDLIEERIAIMTIDGGLSEEDAEATIIKSGYYDYAIRLACGSH